MQTSDFDFDLPPELIAQRPPLQRGDSRMMVIHRESGEIEHRQFSDLRSYLSDDDLLVFNDTRVVPARFFSDDQSKEILRLEAIDEFTWQCLVRPGKKLREGRTITIGGSKGTVIEVLENGDRIISFDQAPDEDKLGHLALPPYIERPDDQYDQERYQTVFADKAGAIAAPTAGLHFSEELLGKLNHEFVTLHVGLGTFRPVSTEQLTEHEMHSEWFDLSEHTTQKIKQANRTIAVGTTVVRVLESCYASTQSPLVATRGNTQIFIYPPYQFGAVDVLLTNFHLPKSTLLMLVSAFANRDLIMEAYRQAVKNQYRFFSYGDCMLIL